VFTARIAGKTEAWSTNFDLYSIPAAGGAAPRNLTSDNNAWDTKAVFSPDGRTLAYLAMSRPGFEADRFHIVLMDVATGKKRHLAESWDRPAGSLQWSADGKTVGVDAENVGQPPPVCGGWQASAGVIPGGGGLRQDSTTVRTLAWGCSAVLPAPRT